MKLKQDKKMKMKEIRLMKFI